MTAQLLSLFLAFLSALSASGANLAEPTALGQYLVLVNHEYTLSSDYEPDDLIKPSVRNDSGAILMREEAAHALEDLFASADADGMHLIATSGYRSYDTQELIYKRKIKNTGSVEKANLLVAIPGTSEHQLGLAMDLYENHDIRSQRLYRKTHLKTPFL